MIVLISFQVLGQVLKEILFFLSFTVRTYENNTMMSLFQNVESSSIIREFWIVHNKMDDAHSRLGW
ncbi:hypothetical protein LEP1GSC137_3360 [Leptospira borgpetersenii str. Noumea 25]|uniref:Uncharacterized protein n=1 Tax=Leptospira borgpetersenii serovar Ballum TaxID=280505 RepID=A0A0E3AYS6_LEPBO|nr:hypothetical protein LBBP_02164 [Leptospira borgpetersenii serovar Ballum]ANH01055.1 Uncharacterized protein LB4E_1722 [Leptospira borgpetersenii str. 4E]EKR00121.1 hypothetical protein LEP1GSC121_3744 [Leptospira borgpetersenii serovar Castellonis str. 200801910]EMK14800.1 hypothetical protein LEP1GSC066_0952 [Leptospira sp. serovar Kenya str. Sh9]EMO09944.1 hypothetical protein LEP1GSC137_3360 [Leptospira borgpetersenii str. Noumea 25]